MGPEPAPHVTGPDIDPSPSPTDTWRPSIWAGIANTLTDWGAGDWAEDWVQNYDDPSLLTTPLLAVQGTPFDFSLGADDFTAVIDALFAQDTVKQKPGITYDWIMKELGNYTEGDPSTGPLQITYAFVNNDPSVPEWVKFGPAAAMTQRIRNDEGVAAARQAFLRGEGNLSSYKFRVDDFFRELGQMGSPVSARIGGVAIDDYGLTEQMLGSYGIRIAETPDGQLLFMVFNETGMTSGTRIPTTDISLGEDHPRAGSKHGGTVHQAYYWTEPKGPVMP